MASPEKKSQDAPSYQSDPSYLTLENLWRAIVLVAALVLLWFFLSDTGFAQSQNPQSQNRSATEEPGATVGPGIEVLPSASAQVEQWAGPHKSYMNRLVARAEVVARWRSLWAEATASGIWWGSGRSKVSGSLLNTESGKVIERRRSLALALAFDLPGSWSLRVGGIVQRRGIHHIWQYKRSEGRHDYFPGGWQSGVTACNGGQAPDWPPDNNQCPSIGYWDTAGPLLILERRWERGAHVNLVRVRVEAPQATWKSLTLPYPRAGGSVTARLREWRLRAEGEAFGPAGFGYDAQVSRSLPGAAQVRLGLVLSDHLPDPGWGKGPGDNLRRVGATLRVSSE
jgi:hypothetical protein